MATSKIVLLGDLALHTMIVRNRNAVESSVHPFKGIRRPATEPLLVAMILKALEDVGVNPAESDIFCPRHVAGADIADLCGELISVLDSFPERSSSRKERDRVRVKAGYFIAPAEVDPKKNKTFEQLCREALGKLLQDACVADLSTDNPNLLVLYDHGSFLRTALKGNPGVLSSLVAKSRGGVIVGINSDLSRLEWLEDALTPVARECDPGVVIQITADGLRKAGVKITKYGTFEETIADIFHHCELKTGPLAPLLRLADHLVIVFSETGGLHLHRRGGALEGSLHFCPNFDRIAQSDPRTYGSVPGKFSIFLVALVKALHHAARSGHPVDFGGAVALATVAYNHHFGEGLGPAGKVDTADFDPFAAFEKALSKENCKDFAERVGDTKKRHLLVSSIEMKSSDPQSRKRAASLLAANDFDQRLRDIVCVGPDAVLVQEAEDWAAMNPKALPFFPKNLITVPYATIGRLTLLDDTEIAKYYNLAKVIRKYLESPDWKTPLSIAVFGRPGTGKSFGVKQILDAVDPGRKGDPLTFNLAQFDAVDQLTEAFHLIQDRALANDEIPLAIFDEFDAYFHTPYGWLKYFLAPMQDGVFRGQSGDYKVGRAIFLFAGGSADSHKKFCEPLQLLTAPADEAGEKDKNVDPKGMDGDNNLVDRTINGMTDADVRRFKLSDFNSRLRGFLDITDISPLESEAELGKMTQVRRAVILRSLLEQHAQPIFVTHADGVRRARIHEKVIDAFLGLRSYTNGVRSMEALIQMSQWIGGEFVPASLPADELLKAHTAGATFIAVA